MTFKVSIKNGGFNSKTTLKIMSKKSQCSKNCILKILNVSSFSIKLFLISHSQKQLPQNSEGKTCLLLEAKHYHLLEAPGIFEII